MSKGLHAMNIVPLADFKTRAAEILSLLKEDRQSVVITQNGKAAAVLVFPREYDSLVERSRFFDAVERGLSDVKTGRLVEHAELVAEVITLFRANHS